MSDLDVAVAIVNYRSAALTSDCLRSIEPEPTMRQTTRQRLRRQSGPTPSRRGVTLVTAPRNGGFAERTNLAIQTAYQGGPPDYFHLLNPNTLCAKGLSARWCASSRCTQMSALPVAILKISMAPTGRSHFVSHRSSASWKVDFSLALRPSSF